ncbi:hypothetical protein ACQKJ1_26425 [Methylorubrum rhodesianum]|uniref:hypothetical protein n=1 Tax=Methylorubrum rhodesianum TaxID=29427 RepID=UPI003D093200
MTLDELDKLKKLAAERERLLEMAEGVQTGPVGSIFPGLTGEMQEIARTGTAAELRRRADACEADLRAKGILFPEPVSAPRPPVSWDAELGEFTFTIASAGVETSERGLGSMGEILVDQVLLPRGQVQSRQPAQVYAMNRNLHAPLGEVVRVWEEDGRILGRVRLRPEASAARAAVASGAVTDVLTSYVAGKDSWPGSRSPSANMRPRCVCRQRRSRRLLPIRKNSRP